MYNSSHHGNRHHHHHHHHHQHQHHHHLQHHHQQSSHHHERTSYHGTFQRNHVPQESTVPPPVTLNSGHIVPTYNRHNNNNITADEIYNFHNSKEKPTLSKTPLPFKTDKALKRKLNFSPGGTSEDEGEKRPGAVTPKRRRSLLAGEGSPNPTGGPPPAVGSTTPKTPGGTQRLTERQQMALLMQMTAEGQPQGGGIPTRAATPGTGGDLSPRPSSPHTGAVTPGSALKRTPYDKKVNKRNERGETPLHVAAIRGDARETKRLLKAGADVNVTDFAGWTAIHEACNHGWLDIAKQLLKAGANVNVQGLDKDTPLHDASVNGHRKLVELLLRHGANPLQANAHGKSALDVAQSEDIRRLLQAEIIASSSSASSLDEVRSPTSPESNADEHHDTSPGILAKKLDPSDTVSSLMSSRFPSLTTSPPGSGVSSSMGPLSLGIPVTTTTSLGGSHSGLSPRSLYSSSTSISPSSTSTSAPTSAPAVTSSTTTTSSIFKKVHVSHHMEKSASPRLTIKFQHIKSKDPKRSMSPKRSSRGLHHHTQMQGSLTGGSSSSTSSTANTADSQFKSYSVTLGSKASKVYDRPISPTGSSTSQESDLYDPQLEITTYGSKRASHHVTSSNVSSSRTHNTDTSRDSSSVDKSSGHVDSTRGTGRVPADSHTAREAAAGPFAPQFEDISDAEDEMKHSPRSKPSSSTSSSSAAAASASAAATSSSTTTLLSSSSSSSAQYNIPSNSTPSSTSPAATGKKGADASKKSADIGKKSADVSSSSDSSNTSGSAQPSQSSPTSTHQSHGNPGQSHANPSQSHTNLSQSHTNLSQSHTNPSQSCTDRDASPKPHVSCSSSAQSSHWEGKTRGSGEKPEADVHSPHSAMDLDSDITASSSKDRSSPKLDKPPKSDKDKPHMRPERESTRSPKPENRWSPKSERGDRWSPKPYKDGNGKGCLKVDVNRASPKPDRDSRDSRDSPKSDKEGNGGRHSGTPKVPPLKIIIPPKTTASEKDSHHHHHHHQSHQKTTVMSRSALPYVVNATSEGETSTSTITQAVAAMETDDNASSCPPISSMETMAAMSALPEKVSADTSNVNTQEITTRRSRHRGNNNTGVDKNDDSSSDKDLRSDKELRGDKDLRSDKDSERGESVTEDKDASRDSSSSSSKEGGVLSGRKDDGQVEKRITRSALRSQQQQKDKEGPSSNNGKDEPSSSKEKEEKERESTAPVTRSSSNHGNNSNNGNNSNHGNNSNNNSNSSNHGNNGHNTASSSSGGGASTSKNDAPEEAHIHPRKRKMRSRQQQQEQETSSVPPILPPQHFEKPTNPYELFLNIRKKIASRQKQWLVVQPKAPHGFQDYLMVSCNYVLEGNTGASRLSVPTLSPPNSLTGSMRDLFIQQEKARYKLRLQHVIEREKLMLSIEQEIVRVHGRAARALANQSIPLSVCAILRDEDIYTSIDGEAEDRDKNIRSRYNGRQFLSWLRDVDDKYEKIKEALLLRHHHEAESLYALQKLEWEWAMPKEATTNTEAPGTSSSASSNIDELHVPMVTVSDEFDLLPA